MSYKESLMQEIQHISLRFFKQPDTEKLCHFYQQLSAISQSRFAPHPFNKEALSAIFDENDQYLGYIALNSRKNEIVAYAIVKSGFIQGDQMRLASYGLQENRHTDCTLAPAVADDWQNMGLGQQLFDFVINDLEYRGFRQVFLWGGVQKHNDRAVRFYKRNGFEVIGTFEHNGQNFDMKRIIRLA